MRYQFGHVTPINQGGREVRSPPSRGGRNQPFTEMCSGSEAGSYLRLINFVYHSTLGLRVTKKKKGGTAVRSHPDGGLTQEDIIHAITNPETWPPILDAIILNPNLLLS